MAPHHPKDLAAIDPLAATPAKQTESRAWPTLLRELAHVEPSALPYGSGDQVGRFRLGRELGRGGFGVVFEARDEVLGRDVAFKALSGRVVEGAAQATGPLLQEAEAAARLAHPNILVVHDFGHGQAGPFIIMELLRGESLHARLRRGPVSIGDALDVAIQIARALEHAHEAGILHRDVKPANVFLARDGAVKLLDFGLAALGASPGSPAGTPGYVAPEQWRGDPHDASADVFSAAALLWQLLTGALPYPLESADGQSPRSLQALDLPRLPAALSELLARALSDDPGPRPRDGHAWLEGLVRARDALGQGEGPAPIGVAVLPFKPPADLEELGVSAMEVVISRLSRLPALRVIARSTVLALPPGEDDFRVIGRALDVAHLVVGEVAPRGGALAGYAELLETSSGRVLASERFQLPIGDPYVDLEAAGGAVASMVAERLAPLAAQARPPARVAAGSRALQGFMRGQFHLGKRTPSAFQAALAEFSAAVEADPLFAPPWVGMAYVHIMSAIYGFARPLEAMPLARAHAERAIGLDGASGEARGALAAVQLFFDHDPRGAEVTARRGVELNPSFAFSRLVLCDVLWALERGEEGLEQIQAAVRLDPLDRGMVMNAAEFTMLAGRPLEAASRLRQLLTLDPQFLPGRVRLSKALAFAGEADEALEALEAICATAPPALAFETAALVHAALGQVSLAHDAVRSLAELASAGRAPAWGLGLALATLGDTESLRWLDRAIDAREPSVVLTHVHPATVRIRGEPGFSAFRRRLGLRDQPPRGAA